MKRFRKICTTLILLGLLACILYVSATIVKETFKPICKCDTNCVQSDICKDSCKAKCLACKDWCEQQKRLTSFKSHNDEVCREWCDLRFTGESPETPIKIKFVFVLPPDQNSEHKKLIVELINRVMRGSKDPMQIPLINVIERTTYNRLKVVDIGFVSKDLKSYLKNKCINYSNNYDYIKHYLGDDAKPSKNQVDKIVLVFVDDKICGKEGAFAGKNSFWLPYGAFIVCHSNLFDGHGGNFLHEFGHTLGFGHSFNHKEDKKGKYVFDARGDPYSIMGGHRDMMSPQKESVFKLNTVMGFYPFYFDKTFGVGVTTSVANLELTNIEGEKQLTINAYIVNPKHSYISIQLESPQQTIYISLFNIIGKRGTVFHASYFRLLVHLSLNQVDTVLLKALKVNQEFTLPESIGTNHDELKIVWDFKNDKITLPKLSILFKSLDSAANSATVVIKK